jgi:hypothetical protein
VEVSSSCSHNNGVDWFHEEHLSSLTLKHLKVDSILLLTPYKACPLGFAAIFSDRQGCRERDSHRANQSY